MKDWCELLSVPPVLKPKRLGVVVIKQKMPRTTTTATDSRDLFQDLQPSVHIHKWFGKEITVKYHANRHSTNQGLSVMEESKAFTGPAK